MLATNIKLDIFGDRDVEAKIGLEPISSGYKTGILNPVELFGHVKG